MNKSSAPFKRIAVIQGEVKISTDPKVEMTTVLGSCVAICLYDAALGLGGMNHYLLSSGADDVAQEKKYGLYAYEYLLNGLLKRGAGRHNLRAKVFGGASIGGKFGNLGPRNASFALEILATEGIPCIAQDVGGLKARKLRFIPCTGEAQVMHVRQMEEVDIKPPLAPPVESGAPEFF